MHSILEMQEYREMCSALVLLFSVLLTSCVTAVSYSTRAFSNWKRPKREKKKKKKAQRSLWPLGGCAGCFVAWHLPPMDKLFVVQLLHYSTTGTTNISGHAITQCGLWNIVIKKVFYFLYRSSQHVVKEFVTAIVDHWERHMVSVYCPPLWVHQSCDKCWEHAQNCTRWRLHC